MKRYWSNRNIDLKALKEEVIELLKEDYFDIDTHEMEDAYQIIAKSSPNYNLDGHVIITLQGKPEEVSIEIELQRKRQRIFTAPLLLTFLGGGYWLSQRLKSDEEWLEFKRRFWERIDVIITNLGSSVNQHTT
ncbi:MAG: hypothetical protein QXJ31_01285 [Candidatus Bathyarchaeia archaeon]